MRLFVALDLPQPVRQRFAGLIARLRKEFPGARWVRPERIHVTLKFIGHAEHKDLESISTALAAVRSDLAVEADFRGLRFFPNEQRPRVLFCGVEASANLAVLAGDVSRALEPQGIASEPREFVPHLTLARLDPGKIPAAELQRLVRVASEPGSEGFGSARETEFYLFESLLKSTGAEYKKLRVFPFVKGSP
jgi:2'-5' RNA ligase